MNHYEKDAVVVSRAWDKEKNTESLSRIEL